jgi:hypothetical protein
MTEVTESQIVDKLITTNPEFKQLHDEHHDLAARVEELFKQLAVSPSVEQEIKRLKKLKLASKDKMRQMILDEEETE